MRSFIQKLPHPVGNTLLFLRRMFGGFYEDGLFTIMNSDFKKTPRFKQAYAAAKGTGSFGNWELRWRIHVLCWAADLASAVEGDFVECGVDHGGTAMAAITYTNFHNLGKRYWLLDTFKGIDRSQMSAKEKRIEAGYFDYKDCYERVKANFADRDYVKIVRGTIPSTLPEVTAEKVAFLHIDLNAMAPEIAALEYFWPKIPPGGVVLMDDYAWPRNSEQKIGFDKFAAAHSVEILHLPTGQGMIVKKR